MGTNPPPQKREKGHKGRDKDKDTPWYQTESREEVVLLGAALLRVDVVRLVQQDHLPGPRSVDRGDEGENDNSKREAPAISDLPGRDQKCNGQMERETPAISDLPR